MRQKLLLLVIIVVVVSAAYWWSLKSYFAADDWLHLDKKALRVGLRPFYADWLWGESGKGGHFRPLSRLSFNFNYLLFGKQAWGYHLTALLLHLLNCLLVYLLADRLLGHRLQALFASLTFGLFPILQQAVFWLSGRSDLLATLFILLTVYLFTDYLVKGKKKFYYLSIFACLLAFCSKESSAALAPLMFLLPLLCWPELVKNKAPSRLVALRNSLIFIALFILYFLYVSKALGGLGGHFRQALKIEKFKITYSTFLSFLYYPFWQDFVTFNIIRFLIYLLFPVAIILGSSKKGVVTYAWLWVLISTFPMLSTAVSPWDGGRLLYLPLVGWSLFLSQAIWVMVRGFSRFNASIDQYGKQGLTKQQETLIYGVIHGLIVFIFLIKLVGTNIEWYKGAQQTRYLVTKVVKEIKEKQRQYAPGRLPQIDFVADRPNQANQILNPWYALKQAMIALIDEELEMADGFSPSTSKDSLVLYIHPDLRVTWKNIKKIEKREWGLASILESWHLGNALKYHVVGSPPAIFPAGEEVGLFEASPPGDISLVSPLLDVEDAWHLLVIYLQPVIIERGNVFWRAKTEKFSFQKKESLLNDMYYYTTEKQLYIGYAKDLAQLRIEPIYRAGRYYLSKITLYSYFLE